MIETFSDTRTEIGPDGPQEYWRVEFLHTIEEILILRL